MFGVIMPLCNRMFCCIFGWYFYIEVRLKYEKNILLSSSRAFFIVYPCGQHWRYMENDYKMQQNWFTKLFLILKFSIYRPLFKISCNILMLEQSFFTISENWEMLFFFAYWWNSHCLKKKSWIFYMLLHFKISCPDHFAKVK